MIRHRRPTLLRDRDGVAALEFALVFPAMLLMLIGLAIIYTLIASRRAVDYGIEKALRSAAVNSAGGTAAVKSAYATAAGKIWTSAGTTNGVTVMVSAGGTGAATAASTFAAGDTVQVSVSFSWVAAASLAAPYANKLFNPSTLTATGTVRVIN